MPKNVFIGNKLTLGIISSHLFIYFVLFYISLIAILGFPLFQALSSLTRWATYAHAFSSPFLNQCREKHIDTSRYVRLFFIKFPQEDYKLFEECFSYIMPFFLTWGSKYLVQRKHLINCLYGLHYQYIYFNSEGSLILQSQSRFVGRTCGPPRFPSYKFRSCTSLAIPRVPVLYMISRRKWVGVLIHQKYIISFCYKAVLQEQH